MLQRMNELAVKAANGTESESDRQNIQDEVDQLATEIDRVAETTKFNETYLLKGDRNAIKGFSLDYAAAKKDDHIVGEGEAKANFATTADANGFKIDAVETVGTDAKSEEVNDLLKALRDQGVTVTYNSHWNPAGNAGAGEAESSVKLELNGAAADKYKVVVTDADNNEFAIQNNEGIDILKGIKVSSAPTTAATASNMDVTISSKLSAESLQAYIKTGDIAQYYDADGNKISTNALDDYFNVTPGTTNTISEKTGTTKVYDAVGNERKLNKAEIGAKQDIIGDLTLKLHVGADATSNNQISVNIASMSAKGLGVNGIKVNGTNDENALDAIETIKSAIAKVSEQRSALGAVQNRLEHTIKNLDNVVENTTAAESQIRDTDMASEMVKYSNNNILTQAGQSMLAQANQSNQGVLSLLG
jgi:flagellin